MDISFLAAPEAFLELMRARTSMAALESALDLRTAFLPVDFVDLDATDGQRETKLAQQSPYIVQTESQ